MDSLEDLIVEKWVDKSTSAAPYGDCVSPGKSLPKNTRSDLLKPRSKESRKTRSSTSESVVAVSPHKRDIMRNALLKYRH